MSPSIPIRVLLCFVGTAVVLASGAAMIPGPVAAAPPLGSHTSAPRGWTVQVGGITVGALACSDTSHCWAVARSYGTGTTEILATTNGGAAWSVADASIPQTINAIACPSTTVCIAAGSDPLTFSGVALYSTDGGATFHTASLPQVAVAVTGGNGKGPAASDLLTVSCVSPTACWAGGNGPVGQASGAVLSSNDGGKTWAVAAQGLPSSVASLSCLAPTSCVGVGAGNAYASTDGTHWSVNVFSTSSSAIQVSCGAPSDCWALVGGGPDGQDLLQTADGGATWTTQKAPGGSFGSLSCTGTAACLMVGAAPSGSYAPDSSVIASTADGGATWVSRTSPVGGGLVKVTCASATACWASGGYTSSTGMIISTTDGGTTWVTQRSEAAIDIDTVTFRTVTCMAQSTCWALGTSPSSGGVVLQSTDSGVTWKVMTTTGSSLPLNSIACPDATHCWAVGPGYSQGFGSTVLATSDGGSTWGVQLTPPDVSNLSALSCLSSTTCVAVGNGTAIRTEDGGRRWSSLSVGIPNTGITSSSLDCVTSTNECWLVSGQSVLRSTDSGTTWLAVPGLPPGSNSDLSAVTCASLDECWVAGNGPVNDVSGTTGLTVLHTTDGGATWTVGGIPAASSAPPSSLSPQNISCPDSKHCWVVAPSGQYYYSGTYGPWEIVASADGGKTWAVQYASPYQISSVACTTSSACVAVGSVSGYGGGGLTLTTTNGGTPPAPVVTESSPAQAYTNLPVTLTIVGQNLSGATAVEIGRLSVPQLTVVSDTEITVSVPASFALKNETDTVVVKTPQGTSGTGEGAPQITFVAPSPLKGGQGFWLTDSNGDVSTYGSAPYLGSGKQAQVTYPTTQVTNSTCGSDGQAPCTLTASYSVTGIAGTRDGDGYWLVTANGEVETFGDADFYGQLNAVVLNYNICYPYACNYGLFALPLPGSVQVLIAPVVSMAATPDGKGYWLVASDGGVFTFGDAKYLGSEGHAQLSASIVGMAATPDGKGYWLVASDGGVFTFGDAGFYGADVCACTPPLAGVVSIVSTPDGSGYWIVHQDGFVLAHGDARNFGQTTPNFYNAVTIVPTPDGAGYWLVANNSISAFGDAPVLKSPGWSWFTAAAP